MHSWATVTEALRLRDEEGLGARQVARRLELPLPTVRDWHAGKLPRHSRPTNGAYPAICPACGQQEHRFDGLGAAYVHLLGLYLGDGSISAHARGVHRLRVFLDMKYPKIVEECIETMRATVPENSVHALLTPSNCYSVSAYSRSWPCLFPQHGPGMKHTRPIFLADWQQALARKWPEQLLKGLIQSDGCRSYSTGAGGWRQPRYIFSNCSTDITSIFCSACDCLGLRWTASFPKRESAAVSIYVSRKDDVARLDEFIGPKR
ncbi:MAG: helix-turn-helix transcriptional regulator [Solirubrobacterales bacterium]